MILSTQPLFPDRPNRQAGIRKGSAGVPVFPAPSACQRETTVLTLDGVQMRIKPQLASVSLLFGFLANRIKGDKYLGRPTSWAQRENGATSQPGVVLTFNLYYHIAILSFLVICSLVCAVKLPWFILMAKPDGIGVFLVGNAPPWVGSCLPGLPLLKRLFPWFPTQG